jgi:hypothetical protein
MNAIDSYSLIASLLFEALSRAVEQRIQENEYVELQLFAAI